MNITQHGPNLWQLTRLFAFNSYLIREEDGLTVIDTNLSGSASAIVKAAQATGLPIKRIAITHAHTDHASSLDALAHLLPNADIAVGSRSAEFLRGNKALLPKEPQAKLRGGYVVQSTAPTRLLADGDRLGSLRVIAAPGHTPDQLAFLDERDGTLIAGDAFQTQGGTAVSGITRWLFPFPAMATWHLPTALQTAIALRNLNPSRLAIGHGPVLDDPIREMDAAIQTAQAQTHGATQTA